MLKNIEVFLMSLLIKRLVKIGKTNGEINYIVCDINDKAENLALKIEEDVRSYYEHKRIYKNKNFK